MHIGIIMDGNGRWATRRGMPRSFGHKKGMTKVIETVEWADERDVDTLTLYAFSTENKKRPFEEVSFLMDLMVYYIDHELLNLHKKNAKINIFGELDGLPEKCRKKLMEAVELTKNNTGLVVNFAINYSSLQETRRALRMIVDDFNDGRFKADEIDESFIKNYLYTAHMEDPDLIIRTGGQIRLSNFMLLQSAYSELVFRDELWPDIDKDFLDDCLNEFKGRKRNFGEVK